MALTKRKLADLRGPAGPVGADGTPSLDSVPTIAGLAAYVLGGAANAFKTALYLLFGVRIWGTGIDNTGVADSTAAIQAILDANPGKRLFLPAGVYKITSLLLSKGQTIVGAGQQDWRDRFSSFGTAGWLNNANFNGTVIRSTLTSGVAIVWLDTEVNSGGLWDLTLIGPGTGTSTGITMGSTTMTVVNANVRNVKIGNFFVGMRTNYVNEGSFHDLMIRGCVTGLNLAYFSNQNAFHMLDIEWCGNGLVISADSASNTFYSMIGQSNSGIAMQDAGIKNTFVSPYFENNTTRAIDVLPTAVGSSFRDLFCNGASDSIRIQALASGTQIVGYSSPATVFNSGTNTYLQGRFVSLNSTGAVGEVVIDPAMAGTVFAAPIARTPAVTGITQGNGVVTDRYSVVGRRVRGTLTFTAGTTTVMNGTAQFALAYSPYDAPAGIPVKVSIFKGGVNWYAGMGYINVSGILSVAMIGASGVATPFTTTTPFSWVPNPSNPGILTVEYDYERA